MSEFRILGIETSCDECSASVVEYSSGAAPLRVLSVATFSQIALHQPYGGVVPEIASRNHLETINLIIDQALKESSHKEFQAIAVTNRPGLIGALLVGVSAAKALSLAWNIPLVPVHHLEAHACSLFLNQYAPDSLPWPMLLAVVSGGHTNLYVVKTPPALWPPDLLKRSLVGRSRDDAAGEAFDKVAKIMGFPYPGGMYIDQAAKGGNINAFSFPRPLPAKDNFDFSFSGLKTAAAMEFQKLQKKGAEAVAASRADFCASFQEAIVDSLWTKMKRAAQEYRCQSLAIVGGVAANSRLKQRLDSEWKSLGLSQAPLFPLSEFCTDNAAMVAAAGAYRFLQGKGFVLTPGSDEQLTLNAFAGAEF